MAVGRKKKLPIGIEDLEKIRTEGFYYVDKTELISGFMDIRGEVNLFTRPRRFGKTLMMDMLRAFFSIGSDGALFEGLKVAEDRELWDQYMGRSPVVSISLKGVSGRDYAEARDMLCTAIGETAMEFQFLEESDRLSAREKQQYAQLVTVGPAGGTAFILSDPVLKSSLKTLTILLEKHYGQKVILLIDEYDVPLAKAEAQGYHEQMILLVRGLLEQALKTNKSLFFSVLTGCLQVAKESIFTGLNNLLVFSVADVRSAAWFGFTDEEVRELLAYYDLSCAYEKVKEWYDGYRFGDSEVYCPWDVLCYCNKLRADAAAEPEAFWSNTSGNDVVRRFVEKMGRGVAKRELECLVAGETVEKRICQELTYDRLYASVDNLWSVLFATGYLTQRKRIEGDCYQLAIPNREIRKIFTEQILTLFKEGVARDGETLERFCTALKNGDGEGVEQQFTAYLRKTVSIRDTFVRKDTKENFYHGILLGILGFKEGWHVSSNRQTGAGYSDIQVEIEEEGLGLVIEMKYAQDAALEAESQRALEQIREKGYAKALWDGRIREVLSYGIACYRDRCQVAVDKVRRPFADP